MKKLFIVALLVVGMTSFAQERKDRKEPNGANDSRAKETNCNLLKKMTLELDLNFSTKK
jgi:hypothetical protein